MSLRSVLGTATLFLSLGTYACAQTLDDAAIIEVAHAANTGEVAAGKLASSRAKNSDVKSFASMMVDDHTKADSKGSSLASKLKITPAPSSLSSQVASDNADDGKKLEAASPGTFDRTYMDTQVAGHTKVLALFDAKLIPSAKAPELVALLKDARGMVAHHLEKAKSIRASLK